MKIAYDHQIFCGQSVGGISRYYCELATYISRTNEIMVFAPFHRNRYLSDCNFKQLKGIGVTRYPWKTSKLIMSLNFPLAKLQLRRWNPDLVHETYYSRFNIAPKNTPTVLTVFDMIHELFPKLYRRNDNTALNKKKAINRADHIICISESTKKDLLNTYSIDEKKISVIYFGFSKFPSLNQNITDMNIDYQNLKKYILYVGSRGGYKNFTNLLLAFGRSSSLKKNFSIVAFGGGPFTRSEKILIEELGLNVNQVTQLSGSDEILGYLYSRASCFIYPSLYEGFGLPILEAMAHNCPVLSSNKSSMPEIGQNAAIYFDPKSPDDISFQLERILFNDNLRSDLIIRGSERILDFSWAKCAHETNSIYMKFKK